jgi:hypothetical protein
MTAADPRRERPRSSRGISAAVPGRMRLGRARLGRMRLGQARLGQMRLGQALGRARQAGQAVRGGAW